MKTLDFLHVNGEQNLILMHLLQKFSSHQGVQIYVKQINAIEEEVVNKKYLNPTGKTELESARKLFFIEDKNLFFSCNEKNEPDGAILIDHLDYMLIVATAGCKSNKENVFISMLIISFLTQLSLEIISLILGSKFSLENYKEELCIYEKIIQKK